jgi:toxin ParE1/3/4
MSVPVRFTGVPWHDAFHPGTIETQVGVGVGYQWARRVSRVPGRPGPIISRETAGGSRVDPSEIVGVGRRRRFRARRIERPSRFTLSFAPPGVLGGRAAAGSVRLTLPAPSSGVQVLLSSADGAVVVPPNVTVAPGVEAVTFPVTTTPVDADRDKRIADYIAQSRPESARRVAQSVVERTGTLEMFPHLGRPGRVQGTREIAFPPLPFVAVYEVREEQVTLISTSRRRSRSSFDGPLTGARAWSRRSPSSAAAFGPNALFTGNGRAPSQSGA